jgi:hypothetical protein
VVVIYFLFKLFGSECFIREEKWENKKGRAELTLPIPYSD